MRVREPWDHERAAGCAEKCQLELPLGPAQPARQPAGPTASRNQLYRAQQRARQAEGMEKANSRHGVPEGEDPATAGSGGWEPEHGPRAPQRADRRTAQGRCSDSVQQCRRYVTNAHMVLCNCTRLVRNVYFIIYFKYYVNRDCLRYFSNSFIS